MAWLQSLRRRVPLWRVRAWMLERPEATRRTLVDLYRHLYLVTTGARHIHVVRERATETSGFFTWLPRNHPQAARLFRYTTAIGPLAVTTRHTALLVPWVQDPVRERTPALFRRLQVLEAACARAGIPVVNPVANLSNAIKSRALGLLREAGFKAARTLHLDPGFRFDHVVAAVGLPFIVRNDLGHDGYVRLIHGADEFASIDWSRLGTPVALEFIDTRSPDGLYRKYRFLVTGDTGVPRHEIIARDWCVRADDRLRTPQCLEEELAYLAGPDPRQGELVRAAKALGLDFVAFDYGIDASGGLVVWEPNPHPLLWSPVHRDDPYFAYQKACIDRVFTHMLRYYLQRAGLPAVPGRSAVPE